MASEYKLLVPLLIHYVHTGSNLDYPLRLIITPSAHFDIGGKDIDVLVKESDRIVANISSTNHQFGQDYGYHIIKTQIELKFNALPLHLDASLTGSILCRMANNHGRESWRNGGICHFTLLELLNNISSSINTTNSQIQFSKKRVYISGYNVKQEDRLTGLFSMTIDGTVVNNNDSKKWVNFLKSEEKLRCVLLKRLNCFNQNSTNSTIVDVSLITITFQRFLEMLYKTTSLTIKTIVDHNSWEQQVNYHWAKYKEMLNNINLKMVLTDVYQTERMKCPWAPMDTTIKEFFLDYTYPPCNAENFEKIGANPHNLAEEKRNFWIGNKQQYKQALLNRELSSTHTLSESPFQFQIEPKDSLLFDWCYVELHKRNSSQKQSELPLLYKEIKNIVQQESENYQKVVYLPFFSFLIHQPLKVYKNYWEVALNVLLNRFGYPKDVNFEEVFFNLDQTSVQKRARLAFQLVCVYSQCIEYLSDFYMSKGTSRNPTDEQVDIEQFSNCLRSMVGDCEETSGGCAQFYFNFISDDESKSWVKHINKHKVLSEMRRILRCNYVLMFNIEGVYLPKQTAGDKRHFKEDEPYRMYEFENLTTEETKLLKENTKYSDLPPKLRKLVNQFYKDTKNVNSAHAALKLFPKTYFEECVNRSYAHTDSLQEKRYHISSRTKNSGPAPFRKSCLNVNDCLCRYHKYKPDEYNNTLPILLGEGTSMLCCDENEYDTCKDKNFKEFFLSNEILNDVAKIPIYSNFKGESDFYQMPLFGTCLEILTDHLVADFTYCRINPKSFTNSSEKPFLRGVSHKQLVFKSDEVVLLPYGHEIINVPPISPSSAMTTTLLNEDGEKYKFKCKYTRFDFNEITPFVKELCYRECLTRIRSRKVKKYNTTNTHSSSNSNCISYMMQLHDSARSIENSYILLNNWTNVINSEFDKPPIQSSEHYNKYQKRVIDFHNHKKAILSNNFQTRGHFLFYLDNYYVTETFLQDLYQSFHKILNGRIKKFGEWKEFFRVTFELETLSEDICMWKIKFDLH